MGHRVLVAKPGLDGHDRGAKVIARALRDAGFEVIYTGIRQSVSSIVRVAIDEDVDLIGISILSGAHVPLTEQLLKKLREEGVNVPVVVGGSIPPRDVEVLRSMGVAAVFTADTALKDTVEAIRRLLEEKSHVPTSVES